jgi:hypothetical protein
VLAYLLHGSAVERLSPLQNSRCPMSFPPLPALHFFPSPNSHRYLIASSSLDLLQNLKALSPKPCSSPNKMRSLPPFAVQSSLQLLGQDSNPRSSTSISYSYKRTRTQPQSFHGPLFVIFYLTKSIAGWSRVRESSLTLPGHRRAAHLFVSTDDAMQQMHTARYSKL